MVVLDFDKYGITFFKITSQDPFGEDCFQLLLNRPFEWTRTIDWIVANICQEIEGGIC
jgi:hypothetical protein